MTELSREEVLRIAGNHVGYRHGEYFFPYECHDSAFLESEGSPKLYYEAQLFAMYEAGATAIQKELQAERAVSDRLISIIERSSRLEGLYYNTNLNPEGFRLTIEGIARDAKAAIAEVTAMRQERKEKPE